jgi:hypothetical protein
LRWRLKVHITLFVFIRDFLEYEHLHFLWGEKCEEYVFQGVLKLLEKYAHGPKSNNAFGDELLKLGMLTRSEGQNTLSRDKIVKISIGSKKEV